MNLAEMAQEQWRRLANIISFENAAERKYDYDAVQRMRAEMNKLEKDMKENNIEIPSSEGYLL